LKGLTPMASIYTSELFRFVHRNINKKISPHALGYLGCFLMAGIAFQDQISGTGMFEELRTVKFLQCFQIGQPWTDSLTSPRKARHEVWLDLACENLDIGIEISCINIDVSATRCACHPT